MDLSFAIGFVAVCISAVSLYSSTNNDSKKEAALIERLSATIEELQREIKRLNGNVEVLTGKTNEFNRDIAILGLKIDSMHDRQDDMADRLEALERKEG